MKKLLSVILTLCLCFGVIPSSVYGNTETNINPKASIKKVQKDKYIEREAIVLLKKKAASNISETSVLSKSMAEDLELPSDVKIVDKLVFSDIQKKSDGSISPYSADIGGSVIMNLRSEKYTTEELVKRLKKVSSIKYAEPNYICSANNSKNYAYQWALNNTGQDNGEYGQDLNLANIWKATNKGNKKSDTIVATIDTGVDYTHESLKDNMWVNGKTGRLAGKHGYDFVNYDNDPMDDDGHGTHVAGIIGGKGADKNGISGVDQGVKIMALKFLDEDGFGDAFDALSAYEYIDKAISLGYKVKAVNNSWGGPGEYESDIFKETIDNLGAKGCISVCAAGNYGTNNDELAEFPANVDSIYNVSVAASAENGKLASFSNYGKNTVDIAAPGSSILSSVSYNNYNPTLYKDSQSSLSNTFFDFETSFEDIAFQNWDDGQWKYMNEGDSLSKLEISNEDFFGDESTSRKSLKWTIDDIDSDGVYNMYVPYISTDSDVPIQMSAAVKIKSGPNGGNDYDYAGTLVVTETSMPSTGKLPDKYKNAEDLFWGDMVGGIGTDTPMNYWENISGPFNEKSKAGKTRALVFSYIPLESGDTHEIFFDDIGISLGGAKGSDAKFGKYAFYSGTSMATPMVTGAIALLSEAKPKYLAAQLALEIKNMTGTKLKEGQVSSNGILNLSKYTNSKPHIMSAKVVGSNVIVKGFEFGAAKGKIKVNGKEKSAKSWKNTSITVAASGVKNKNVNFELTNSRGQTAKATIYVVVGKATFKKEGTVADSFGGSLTTDGKSLYFAGSDGIISVLEKYRIKKKTFKHWEELDEISPKKMFPDATPSELENGDVTFESELAYLDGYFYGIVCLDTGFSSCLALASYDVKKDKWARVADCPGAEIKASNVTKDFLNVRMSSLATYNGKLYLMGGFNTATEKPTHKVRVFNPKKKKWRAGKSLPEGRFLGIGRQIGKKLVLSMGGNGKENDNSATAPLIYNGKNWKKGKSIKAMTNSNYYITPETENSKAKTVKYFNAAVGIIKGGLVYSGLPADNLGDTYSYSLKKGKYSPSSYQYSEKTDNEEMIGISLGRKFYVTSIINVPEYYDEWEDWGSVSSTESEDELGDLDDIFYSESLYSMPVKSGFYKVTSLRSKGGTISGAGTHLPGQNVKLQAIPKKKYYYKKKMVVGGKKTKKSTYTIKNISKNIKAKAYFAKYTTKVTLNASNLTMSAGNSITLKATVKKPAFNNKKVKWSVSNKKYAKVSSNGKVTLLSKGKGKTVKVTARAKDGSGAKAVCKITIR